MATVTINQSEVRIKEWQGNRVVTFKDIDLVHGRPDGTARKRFNDNKDRFIEGTDYYKTKCSEVRPFFGQTLPNGFNPKADIILITESGYLMLVKSFTDDLAWDVQRQLVNLYFRVQHQLEVVSVENKTPALPSRLVVRDFYGEKVITSFEAAEYFMQTTDCLRYHAKTFFDRDLDYFFLTGEDLIEFKAQNLSYTRQSSRLFVYTKSGFLKFCERFGVAVSDKQASCFDVPKVKKDIVVNGAYSVKTQISFESTSREELLESYTDLSPEEVTKVLEFITKLKHLRELRINETVSAIALNLLRIKDLLRFFTNDDFDANSKNKYYAALEGLISFGFELFNEIQNLKREF